jgi:hypothetical protein
VKPYSTATLVVTKPEVSVAKVATGKPVAGFPILLAGADVPDCPCHLVGIDSGSLFLKSERQIPESSAVVVSLDHVRFSGIVAGCLPAGRDWVISVALASCKRRLDERIPQGEQCTVAIVGADHTNLRPCTIINTSAFGVGLHLGFPIDTGARVCIEREQMMILGEVRYCHAKIDGQFIAGILIVDVVPDLCGENPFSVMLHNLRWKLASSIRGKDVPTYRTDL